MILISHRGNINGRNIDMENTIDYIDDALDQGYHVEVDVWMIGDKLYLGHDSIQEEITTKYLMNPKLWVH